MLTTYYNYCYRVSSYPYHLKVTHRGLMVPDKTKEARSQQQALQSWIAQLSHKAPPKVLDNLLQPQSQTASLASSRSHIASQPSQSLPSSLALVDLNCSLHDPQLSHPILKSPTIALRSQTEFYVPFLGTNTDTKLS